MVFEDWTEASHETRALPRDVRGRLVKLAHVLKCPKGKSVFGPEKVPDGFLFMVKGTVRVSQTSGSGREIVLYRVEAGESCVLTTACMLSEEAYYAEGYAETDVVAVELPRLAFDQLIAEEESFRNFVFAAYSRRLIDLLRVVDDVTFGRIDVRLAEKVLHLAGSGDVISVTHQQLSVELGTAREVISRVLQDFQKRNLIQQSRGKIELTDRAGLSLIMARD